MTIKKKNTNINKRLKGIGRLYKNYSDDIWGKFLFQNLKLDVAHQNMQKAWLIIQEKRFSDVEQDEEENDEIINEDEDADDEIEENEDNLDNKVFIQDINTNSGTVIQERELEHTNSYSDDDDDDDDDEDSDDDSDDNEKDDEDDDEDSDDEIEPADKNYYDDIGELNLEDTPESEGDKNFFGLSDNEISSEVFRVDYVKPKKKSGQEGFKFYVSNEAKKLRSYYSTIPFNQLKKILKTFRLNHLQRFKTVVLLLETRLDSAIYRLHFTDSVFAGRQLINHGKITVNGKVVDKQSYQLREFDIISVVLSLRNDFLESILKRLLPFSESVIMYYYPIYYEVNYRILSATKVENTNSSNFGQNMVPYFSEMRVENFMNFYMYKR